MSGNLSGIEKQVFKSVHPDEIDKIITNLKATKYCGVDNIDYYLIKLASKKLFPVITHIVKYFLFSGKWLKSYHYTIASKIHKRARFKQVVDYFETNDLVHPSH